MRKFVLAAALGATALAGTVSSVAAAQTPPPPVPRTAAAPPPPPPPPPPGGMLRMADANRDGVVTREEVLAAVDRHFAELDANHDGKVTRDERRAFREQRREERRAARADAPPPPPPGAEGPRGHGPGGRHGMKDRDETLAQARDRALKQFDRADTNHDGRVDERERAAMALLMRARMADHDRRGPPPPPPGADPAP